MNIAHWPVCQRYLIRDSAVRRARYQEAQENEYASNNGKHIRHRPIPGCFVMGEYTGLIADDERVESKPKGAEPVYEPGVQYVQQLCQDLAYRIASPVAKMHCRGVRGVPA